MQRDGTDRGRWLHRSSRVCKRELPHASSGSCCVHGPAPQEDIKPRPAANSATTMQVVTMSCEDQDRKEAVVFPHKDIGESRSSC